MTTPNLTTPNPLPEFFRVRQRFESHRIDDLAGAVHDALHSAAIAEKIRPGQRVAISVGSRGINNLSTIVGSIVREIQAVGGQPFIVPAMGSHGGATAEGQAKVLATYGVTEQAMGCPVVASMETILVGTTAEGVDVHFDQRGKPGRSCRRGQSCQTTHAIGRQVRKWIDQDVDDRFGKAPRGFALSPSLSRF